MKISKDVVYAGVADTEIDLFESQYEVPDGVTYNSYVICDEKTAVMDTVDARKTDEWMKRLKEILGERKPSYLVISHVEPDHAGSVDAFLEAYPETEVVGNAKTFQFLFQFFPGWREKMHMVTVSEGEILNLGKHSLQFFMAPMVHWPEVMVSYDSTDRILFSADGFGSFGTDGLLEDWACEARRYYINIVGKYGAMVQALLKKASALALEVICPLHGPVLSENLGYYLEKYHTWSSYVPEDKGVLIAYASIHGHTAAVAKEAAELLGKRGEKVEIYDLARDDMSEAVEGAFRYDRMLLAGATYDGGIFPCMEDFLSHLKSKAYQNRTVALIENGTWAPMAGKHMRQALESMKNITILEDILTIKSAPDKQTWDALRKLVEKL